MSRSSLKILSNIAILFQKNGGRHWNRTRGPIKPRVAFETGSWTHHDLPAIFGGGVREPSPNDTTAVHIAFKASPRALQVTPPWRRARDSNSRPHKTSASLSKRAWNPVQHYSPIMAEGGGNDPQAHKEPQLVSNRCPGPTPGFTFQTCISKNVDTKTKRPRRKSDEA